MLVKRESVGLNEFVDVDRPELVASVLDGLKPSTEGVMVVEEDIVDAEDHGPWTFLRIHPEGRRDW